jgi:hypothetical protein
LFVVQVKEEFFAVSVHVWANLRGGLYTVAAVAPAALDALDAVGEGDGDE